MFYKARFFGAGLAVLLLAALAPMILQSANNPEKTPFDAAIAVSSTDGCDCGVWGDVTGDGLIDPMDVIYMLNLVYRFTDNLVQPPSCPYAAGDVNCDEAIDPLDVTIFVNMVYRGNSAGSCGNPCGNASGAVTAWSGCKEFPLGKTTTSPGPDQDCIQYEYDGLGTLLLTHVNGGFNCCPDSIIAKIDIGIGNIIIDEDEWFWSTGCWCLCLFDVDYEIANLPPGVYTIRINGLYLEEGDEPLEFTADLTSATVGEFCVPRTHYPWSY